jgi:hypothetical protein
MKKLKNSLILTTIIPLFSTAMLVAPTANAQQLNQVRAFIAPTMTSVTKQTPYFPSEQQIQQALLEPVATSSFPPLEPQQQVFINQFSTPDAPRVRPTRQFAAPIQMFDNTSVDRRVMRQKYNQPSYRQQALKFPGTPRSLTLNRAKGNFPRYVGSTNSNPFSFPDAFPAMPFANNNGLNPISGGNNHWGNSRNNFPFMPNSSKSNKKKAWGDKRNIWPDFYTDFTDTAWDESMGAPRKLGRMPGGWRFPYISAPDPVTVSDAVTNQFPPIAEEAGHMVDISKWGVFDGQ